MNNPKTVGDISAKLKRLQDEEKELVAAVSKLKGIKNKLKVEELGLMAELRERSMQAAQVMSQSGVDLTAAANDSIGEAKRQPAAAAAGGSHQPQLQLDITNTRHFQEEEEEEDDDEEDEDLF